MPEQFRVEVPAGAARWELGLESGAADGELELYVRRGQRVEVFGQTVLADGSSPRSSNPGWSIDQPAAGVYFIAVRNFRARPEPCLLRSGGGGVRLLRGDPDETGTLGINDPIVTLIHLFVGGVAICREAADFDADGRILINDPILLLEHIFLGRHQPAPPYPQCGQVLQGKIDECSGKGCR
jgi:hypothetical protein